jgi:hypothetical protein
MSYKAHAATLAAAVVTALAVPMVAAAPAHADTFACMKYLFEHPSSIDVESDEYLPACTAAADGKFIECTNTLELAGVDMVTRNAACQAGLQAKSSVR